MKSSEATILTNTALLVTLAGISKGTDKRNKRDFPSCKEVEHGVIIFVFKKKTKSQANKTEYKSKIAIIMQQQISAIPWVGRWYCLIDVSLSAEKIPWIIDLHLFWNKLISLCSSHVSFSISFVSVGPFENEEESGVSSLTHVLPFVSLQFKEVCRSDLLWMVRNHYLWHNE